MDFSWLWQSVVAQIVWEILLILGLSVVLAKLKEKWPKVASAVLYGLAASVLILICIVSIRFNVALSDMPKQVASVTPENVHENIRLWLDEFNYKVTRINPTNQIDFGFQVDVPSSGETHVYITKPTKFGGNDRFLYFRETLELLQDDKDFINKLSQDKWNEVMSKCALELARSRVEFNIEGNRPNVKFHLTKLVPITATMTDATMIDAIDDVVRSGAATFETFSLAARNK